LGPGTQLARTRNYAGLGLSPGSWPRVETRAPRQSVRNAPCSCAPIFGEMTSNGRVREATPEHLTEAIVDCVRAGALPAELTPLLEHSLNAVQIEEAPLTFLALLPRNVPLPRKGSDSGVGDIGEEIT
jgi:hypothetical protein